MTYAIIDRRTWKVVARAERRNQLPKPHKGLVVDTNHLERLPEKDIADLYQHMVTKEGVPHWVIDSVKTTIEGRRGKTSPQQGTRSTHDDDTNEGPVAKVRRIAQAMPGASRTDVIAACVKAGINLHTARTQYQRWHAAKETNA